jgi:hypothetical protein
VSPDLAPAIGRVAAYFNSQNYQAAGRCARVRVIPADSAAVTAQVDGQGGAGRLPPVGAWIPDSSLWVDVARSFPVGAQTVQPTGLTVAASPLVIAMPASVAAAARSVSTAASWKFLLPPSLGGPPASLGLRVDLPDPSQSAAGLDTLIEISRLLGSGPAAGALYREFVSSPQITAEFDTSSALSDFVASAKPPFNGRPVTVSTEQAVVSYDRANPATPLAARYPTGSSALLGSPELDYPYVLTTSDRPELAVARKFERVLRRPYASAVIRYAGFRLPDGAGDAIPGSFGLSAQTLQPAPAPSASRALTTLQAWEKLGLGSRDLTLVDTSAAMASRAGPGGQTLAKIVTQTAGLGLALAPDGTQAGLWEFASHLAGPLPYRQLVAVGPLAGNVGQLSRRQQLQRLDRSLRPGHRPAALYSAVLAAYQHMVATYQSRYANAVDVLTAGVNNAPGGISLATLLAKLRALYNRKRKVEIVVVMAGRSGNFSAMQQIAAATGGKAYQVSTPAQLGQLFVQAVAQRTCDPSCGT